jgi:hypothetical protein
MYWILTGFFITVPSLAWAQASGLTPSPDPWRQLLGVLINTAGVMLVVQGIKWTRPRLVDQYGYMLPVLATALGPLLMLGQGWLTMQLGFQGFDFTPITAALTGTTAVAANQVYKQYQEGPKNDVSN